MFRSLPDTLLTCLQHGVRIPHKHVEALRRTDTLIRQARHRASAIIRDAQESADQHRRAGFDAGFRDGTAQTLPELTRCMSEYKSVVNQTLADTLAQLENRLTALFDAPEMQFKLIRQLVEEFADETDCELILPAALRKNPAVSEYLQQPVSVPVTFRFNDTILLRAGKKLLYLTPETFAEKEQLRINSAVLQNLSSQTQE